MRAERPIALGRTAEVYAWEEGWVLKLFHEWFPEGAIRHESRLAQLVHAAGLPVPAVGSLIEVNGRLGLLYERVDGPSMRDDVLARPWTLWRSARLLAELQVAMHAASADAALPRQHQRLEEKIQQAEGLGPELRAMALGALARLSSGDRICHGDFHPGNVILSANGPVVIDWIDATLGNPLADVARSSVILRGTVARGGTPWRLQAMVRWYHRAYLRCYFDLVPGGEDQYRTWYPVVAAARMDEGIAELQDWLRSQAGVLAGRQV